MSIKDVSLIDLVKNVALRKMCFHYDYKDFDSKNQAWNETPKRFWDIIPAITIANNIEPQIFVFCIDTKSTIFNIKMGIVGVVTQAGTQKLVSKHILGPQMT